MLELLGQSNQEYLDRAKEIKDGINNYLWMNEKGYYGQYLYVITSYSIHYTKLYEWKLQDGDAGTYVITVDLDGETIDIEKQ